MGKNPHFRGEVDLIDSPGRSQVTMRICCVAAPKNGWSPAFRSRPGMASFLSDAPSAGATTSPPTAVTVRTGQERPRSSLQHHERGATSEERAA
jgi:hypothetical protein